MKIGLEFEGVIRNYETDQITRWSKISAEDRERIQRLIYTRRPRVDPCDRYDALAEARTKPIENPTAEKLITALFSEMESTSNAFMTAGYTVQWWEQEIPKALHDEIRGEFNRNDPDGKKNKLTYTIANGMPGQYVSEGNLFRGGGLHINVSSVPYELGVGLAIELHKTLYPYRGYCFQSHYRTNLLFRQRYPLNERGNNDMEFPILEYMSHGFNVKTLKDWQARWAHFENQGYGYPPEFQWAKSLMTTLTHFKNAVKAFK